jgi:hypothetical protein
MRLCLAAALALCLGGCDSCEHEAPDSAGPVDHGLPSAPAVRYATVVGRVTLAEGAALPYYPDYMIPSPPGNAPPPSDCPSPRLSDHTPVRLDAQTRGLVGAMVAATEFDTAHAPQAEPVTRDVEIRDCLLAPQFVVANVGDTLRITNRSTYPYFANAQGYGGTTQAVIRDQPPHEVQLDHPGITQVSCSAFGIGCGRADMVVLANPVWTLTAASGTYRIEHIPPGAHVELHAWHPLFEEASQTVDLAAGETKTVDLVLRPAPLPPPPPPPPPHDPNQVGDIPEPASGNGHAADPGARALHPSVPIPPTR